MRFHVYICKCVDFTFCIVSYKCDGKKAIFAIFLSLLFSWIYPLSFTYASCASKYTLFWWLLNHISVSALIRATCIHKLAQTCKQCKILNEAAVQCGEKSTNNFRKTKNQTATDETRFTFWIKFDAFKMSKKPGDLQWCCCLWGKLLELRAN